MRRIILRTSIPVLAVAFALIARPYSLGTKLGHSAEIYSQALSAGNAAEARAMMSHATAEGLSLEFLSRLAGSTAPTDFRFDGTDSRGFRMTGSAGEDGSRVIWLSKENGIHVTHDTALNNILGSAVILCRENALADPDGCCPVSGKPYEFNTETGLVVCPEGHLGEGIVISSNACALKRDSVVFELNQYLEAGYDYPETLEEMVILSGGAFVRSGGYRCPDKGYKCYEIRDGEIYCPFHEKSFVVEV